MTNPYVSVHAEFVVTDNGVEIRRTSTYPANMMAGDTLTATYTMSWADGETKLERAEWEWE